MTKNNSGENINIESMNGEAVRLDNVEEIKNNIEVRTKEMRAGQDEILEKIKEKKGEGSTEAHTAEKILLDLQSMVELAGAELVELLDDSNPGDEYALKIAYDDFDNEIKKLEKELNRLEEDLIDEPNVNNDKLNTAEQDEAEFTTEDANRILELGKNLVKRAEDLRDNHDINLDVKIGEEVIDLIKYLNGLVKDMGEVITEKDGEDNVYSEDDSKYFNTNESNMKAMEEIIGENENEAKAGDNETTNNKNEIDDPDKNIPSTDSNSGNLQEENPSPEPAEKDESKDNKIYDNFQKDPMNIKMKSEARGKANELIKNDKEYGDTKDKTGQKKRSDRLYGIELGKLQKEFVKNNPEKAEIYAKKDKFLRGILEDLRKETVKNQPVLNNYYNFKDHILDALSKMTDSDRVKELEDEFNKIAAKSISPEGMKVANKELEEFAKREKIDIPKPISKQERKDAEIKKSILVEKAVDLAEWKKIKKTGYIGDDYVDVYSLQTGIESEKIIKIFENKTFVELLEELRGLRDEIKARLQDNETFRIGQFGLGGQEAADKEKEIYETALSKTSELYEYYEGNSDKNKIFKSEADDPNTADTDNSADKPDPEPSPKKTVNFSDISEDNKAIEDEVVFNSRNEARKREELDAKKLEWNNMTFDELKKKKEEIRDKCSKAVVERNKARRDAGDDYLKNEEYNKTLEKWRALRKLGEAIGDKFKEAREDVLTRRLKRLEAFRSKDYVGTNYNNLIRIMGMNDREPVTKENTVEVVMNMLPELRHHFKNILDEHIGGTVDLSKEDRMDFITIPNKIIAILNDIIEWQEANRDTIINNNMLLEYVDTEFGANANKKSDDYEAVPDDELNAELSEVIENEINKEDSDPVIEDELSAGDAETKREIWEKEESDSKESDEGKSPEDEPGAQGAESGDNGKGQEAGKDSGEDKKEQGRDKQSNGKETTETINDLPEGMRDQANQELKNIDQMNKKEKKTILEGLANFGYRTTEAKSWVLGKFCKGIGKATKNRKFLNTYFNEYANIHEKTSQRAKKMRETIGKQGLSKASGVGQGFGNFFRYGRVVYDIADSGSLRKLNPFRHVTATAMFLGRSAEAAKETRFTYDELIEKTRVGQVEDFELFNKIRTGELDEKKLGKEDKIKLERAEKDEDRAMEEAMKIYNSAVKNKKGEKVNAKELEKAYKDQLPEDIQERFNRMNLPATKWYKIYFNKSKDIKVYADRLMKKIDKIKNNKKLSPEEKEQERNKLLERNNLLLEDLDRMVGDQGTIDNIAYWSRLTEKVGKGVATALIIDSVARLAKAGSELSYIFSTDYWENQFGTKGTGGGIKANQGGPVVGDVKIGTGDISQGLTQSEDKGGDISKTDPDMWMGTDNDLDSARIEKMAAFQDKLSEIDNNVKNQMDSPALRENITLGTIRRGDGITHALMRQLAGGDINDNNFTPNAKHLDEMGFSGDHTDKAAIKIWAQKKSFLIAKDSGYIDVKGGSEIRLGAKAIGKVSYVLEKDINGTFRVHEKVLGADNIFINKETHGPIEKFEGASKESYEYIHEKEPTPPETIETVRESIRGDIEAEQKLTEFNKFAEAHGINEEFAKSAGINLKDGFSSDEQDLLEYGIQHKLPAEEINYISSLSRDAGIDYHEWHFEKAFDEMPRSLTSEKAVGYIEAKSGWYSKNHEIMSRGFDKLFGTGGSEWEKRADNVFVIKGAFGKKGFSVLFDMDKNKFGIDGWSKSNIGTKGGWFEGMKIKPDYDLNPEKLAKAEEFTVNEAGKYAATNSSDRL